MTKMHGGTKKSLMTTAYYIPKTGVAAGIQFLTVANRYNLSKTNENI